MSRPLTTPRVLLLVPYFGDKPPWFSWWQAEEIPRLERQGFDVLLDFDLDGFKARVERVLGDEGVTCRIEPNTGKTWDMRPALGVLYENEISNYGYYGHCDLDMFFGRINQFIPWDREWDIFSDCSHDYLSGPWTIYKNIPSVRDLFMRVPDWQSYMNAEQPTAWMETVFSDVAKDLVRVVIECHHAFDGLDRLTREGERLLLDGREVSHVHFRRTKTPPEGL